MFTQSVGFKVLVILEVVVVVFVFVPLATLGIYRLFPGFESWQTEVLGFPFPVFFYVVMIALVILLIKTSRKSFIDYGITIANTKYHLDIAATCFIPVALSNFPFALGISETSWSGAFILAAFKIALLFFLAIILRKKPTGPGITTTVTGVLFILPAFSVISANIGNALLLFITYAFFVGFGEEILYRGYVQSRLNQAFGKPYRFFGLAFGWGIILASLLFGLTHVGILRWFIGMTTQVTWAWGFWTVFSGLVFGYIREKTGSILAPALLHGLPQAIAVAVVYLL